MLLIFSKVEEKDSTKAFHYLVGRKIKERTQPYTQSEIESPFFFVKGNEILRILLKWVEELANFSSLKKMTI